MYIYLYIDHSIVPIPTAVSTFIRNNYTNYKFVSKDVLLGTVYVTAKGVEAKNSQSKFVVQVDPNAKTFTWKSNS